jgi:starch phosphorylase
MNDLSPSPARALPDVDALQAAILDKLTYAVGKTPDKALGHDWYAATALAIRDRIVDRWMDTTRAAYGQGSKRVYYLSVEFLLGRLLGETLCNLGLTDTCRAALEGLGVDFDEVRATEPDAALGNGGLGRLAACFMESMATVGLAAYGYGIRYEHGLFRQSINDGWQVELPESWLDFGNPWEFERPEVVYEIGFGGRAEPPAGDKPGFWEPADRVLAVAYDTPMVGFGGNHVNTLRLWSARSDVPMQLDTFNRGEFVDAFAERLRDESISRVLYPDDSTARGRELRLRQEFFFTSASLQDLLRRHVEQHGDVRTLAEHAAIQLNDTHPALAVPELIRLLVDVHGMEFSEAWEITRQTISYTNHTLLPEALETWAVPLVERLLPRHLQIVYQINAFHLDSLHRRPDGETHPVRPISIIDETNGRLVRMGHLAFLGSRKVNGVSELHTELMRQTVFKELHALFPDRITAKTNGITLRRWLKQANPELAALITDSIGPAWLTDGERLRDLVPFADDAGFLEAFATIKRRNKARLANVVGRTLGLDLDPAALFDVQIKRMHEYKRQLLNILEAIAVYQAIKAGAGPERAPRVKIFAGKAAASYHHAKLIIKLINDVAKVVNADPAVRGRLRVVFLPNYNVSLAEVIIPAADLSEQISTAGMEASGTGNMKFALNGALTIGTLDGANIEIRDHVGADNIFIFGLRAEEVAAARAQGFYPRAVIERTPALRAVLDAVAGGTFSPDDPGRFRPLVDHLLDSDRFLVTADFASFQRAQADVDALWRQPGEWRRRAVLNTANVGWFSSDRTIREYAEEIWEARPVMG